MTTPTKPKASRMRWRYETDARDRTTVTDLETGEKRTVTVGRAGLPKSVEGRLVTSLVPTVDPSVERRERPAPAPVDEARARAERTMRRAS